jgi:hypothetical protein
MTEQADWAGSLIEVARIAGVRWERVVWMGLVCGCLYRLISWKMKIKLPSGLRGLIGTILMGVAWMVFVVLLHDSPVIIEVVAAISLGLVIEALLGLMGADAMKRIKVSVAKLALVGLAMFSAAIVWAVILARHHDFRTAMEGAQELGPSPSQLKQLSDTGGAWIVSSPPIVTHLFDRPWLLGLVGLSLFVGASLFGLARTIHRRFGRH